jgi:toxin ParE1/3/4
MTYAVILRPRAEDDIRTAFQWYESQQSTLGEEFLAHLRRALERIRDFPESSPVVHRTVRRALITKFPYLVFYVAEPTRAVVLAVLHTSRSPATWPRR